MQSEKTAFISYRRADLALALLVFNNLKRHGYDVFIDYDGIASGDFEQNIIGNIRARAHFLLVLTPQTLQRCNEPGDWIRREIEAAIAYRRNIVPIMFEDFDFNSSSVMKSLCGGIAALPKYSGLRVPLIYLDAAMERLRDSYLNRPLHTILHPISIGAARAAAKQQAAATAASEDDVSPVSEPVLNPARMKPRERARPTMQAASTSLRTSSSTEKVQSGAGAILPDADKSTAQHRNWALQWNAFARQIMASGNRLRGRIAEQTHLIVPRDSALTMFVGAASIALLVQATYFWRDEIAARWPFVRPVLLVECRLLRCLVQPPVRKSAVTIEEERIQAAAGADTYLLSVLLRNRDAVGVRFPHLQLTLTDATDQPVLRRTLSPDDYLGSDTRSEGGVGSFSGQSEVPVRLTFELSNLHFVGYRLEMYYP